MGRLAVFFVCAVAGTAAAQQEPNAKLHAGAFGRFERSPSRRGALELVGIGRRVESVEPFGKVICKAMKITDPAIRVPLRELLAKTGEKSMGKLYVLLGSKYPLVRDEAAKRAATLGAKSLRRVSRMLDNKSGRIAARGLHVVQYVEQPPAEWEVLAYRAAKDERPQLRQAACGALIAMKSKRCIAARVELLLDSDPAVAKEARRHIARRPDRVWPALLNGISKTTGKKKAALIAALSKLDAAVAPQLESAVFKANNETLPWILRALKAQTFHYNYSGRALPEPVLEQVWKLVSSKSKTVRREAALAYIELPDQTVGRKFKRLETLIKWKDPEIQSSARLKNAIRLLVLQPAEFKKVLPLLDPERAMSLRTLIPSPEFEPSVSELDAYIAAQLAKGAGVSARTFSCLGALKVRHAKAFLESADSNRDVVPLLVELSMSSAPGSWSHRKDRLKSANKADLAIAERALAWLAKTQSADGRWNSKKLGGHPEGDVGVTSLAILAFGAAGHTCESKSHGETVRRGVTYLTRSSQRSSVALPAGSSSFLQHGMATAALADQATLAPRPSLIGAVKQATDTIVAGRNRHMGWRYRPGGGENDTFVTIWMAYALLQAELAGVAAPDEAMSGADVWLSKMTDREFGQVGYNVPGGLPALPRYTNALETTSRLVMKTGEGSTQSMTAGAGWLRLMLRNRVRPDDRQFDTKRSVPLATRLVDTQCRKRWTGEETANCWSLFFEGRLFGALLSGNPTEARLDSGRAISAWQHFAMRAIRKRQSSDGSFPANGIWGPLGGKVQSTALHLLALLAPYSDDPARFGFTKEPMRDAVNAKLLEFANGNDRYRANTAQRLYRAPPAK